jgi:hypothetical protein
MNHACNHSKCTVVFSGPECPLCAANKIITRQKFELGAYRRLEQAAFDAVQPRAMDIPLIRFEGVKPI